MKRGHVDLPPDVAAALSRIEQVTGAEAIHLFGSRARGDHHPDSDWDVAIILPDDVPPGRFTREGLRPLHRGTGIETHPIRRSVFERTRDRVGTLSRSIHDDGIPIRAGAAVG